MAGVQVFRSIYAQATGVVFAGRNGLDVLELRLGVVRIPEVSLRIREAQRLLDQMDIERVDLLGVIASDDESFFRNIKIKSLLAAIVQVGLYDRLLKTQRAPDVVVGNSNGDSALLVCSGQMTFERMVVESTALQTLQVRTIADTVKTAAAPSQVSAAILPLPMGNHAMMGASAYAAGPALPLGSAAAIQAFEAPEVDEASLSVLPSLTGVSLTEFRAFVRSDDGGMVEAGQPGMDLKRLVTDVVEHQGVTRYVNIGPASALPTAEYETIAEATGADEVTIIDSIDLDPMLNWFWKQVRPAVG